MAVLFCVACSHSRAPTRPAVAPAPPPPLPAKLIVLVAESDAFPDLAHATTESLLQARVRGLGAASVSKVSLEVVQLSIECVDPTTACYQAVGRSLAADGLLFAQITTLKRRQLKVTISLFDVGEKTLKTRAERVFGSEEAAAAGLADLVVEATGR